MFRNDHDTYDRHSSYDSYGRRRASPGKQRCYTQTTNLMPAPWSKPSWQLWPPPDSSPR